MQAIANREARYVLDVNVKLDDAYLGGECMDGKVGGGSENKVVFVISVSLTVKYLPFRVRLTRVPGFTLQPVAAWAKDHLALESTVSSNAWPGSVRSPRRTARITRKS